MIKNMSIEYLGKFNSKFASFSLYESKYLIFIKDYDIIHQNTEILRYDSSSLELLEVTNCPEIIEEIYYEELENKFIFSSIDSILELKDSKVSVIIDYREKEVIPLAKFKLSRDNLFYTNYNEKELICISLKTGKKTILYLPENLDCKRIEKIEVSLDSKYIAVVYEVDSYHSSVVVWNIANYKIANIIQTGTVYNVSFNKDNYFIISSGRSFLDGNFNNVFEPFNKTLILENNLYSKDTFVCISNFYSNTDYFYTYNRNTKTVDFFNFKNKHKFKINLNLEVTSILFSNDGNLLIANSKEEQDKTLLWKVLDV